MRSSARQSTCIHYKTVADKSSMGTFQGESPRTPTKALNTRLTCSSSVAFPVALSVQSPPFVCKGFIDGGPLGALNPSCVRNAAMSADTLCSRRPPGHDAQLMQTPVHNTMTAKRIETCRNVLSLEQDEDAQLDFKDMTKLCLCSHAKGKTLRSVHSRQQNMDIKIYTSSETIIEPISW